MQIIASGLIFGCIYALAALGLVLIFKTTEVANFAHGEMAMITTFISYVFLSKYGFPYLASLGLALLFALVFGIVVYVLIMKRVQSAPHLNQVVLTLGLFMIFNGLAGLKWGYQPTSFPEAFHGDPFKLGSVFISTNEIFTVGLTLVLMLLFFLLFRFTKAGLGMRAASQDIMASELMGIKVSGVFMGAWAIGTALGGIAGMMTAPVTFLSPNMMGEVLIIAFAGAVLGGFNSLPGAVIGGLIVGVFENLVSYYVAPELKIVFTFLLIVVVLYIRPQGIFGGAKIVKKV
ncbi:MULTISPECIES: branched-chain amino acid ABC transporter permease [Neobacillus]|uniref:Branched-chain amino acid ABC transporter permease n=1 Tax=Neobacillus citreus TaxID=2833578 RepID=A0A942Y6A3_9BACI|nr:branched-chain amino acid ABC transporter permease [Neobacillus citreus]MCH6263952.1 branched-chain amino acid ABC transporter permease [Neobacillus citreus]